MKGYADWRHLAYEMPHKTWYWRTDRGEMSMRKKSQADTGWP